MNRYRITNTVTGEVVEKEAEYLGTALAELGWDIHTSTCEIVPEEKRRRGRPPKPQDDKPTEEKMTETPAEPPVPQDLVDRARAVGEADQADAAAVDRAQEKLKTEIEKLDIHRVTGDSSEAEKTAYGHKQEIETLALGAEIMFLKMGQLLYDARIAGEWSILHYESYREYCESLKLPVSASYSWATRLSSIYEYLVKNMGLDEKLLAEIGVSKLTRLLPLARKGELTQEVIDAALLLSDLDLRAELGHSVSHGESEEDIVVCPRCGEKFNAKTATRES